MPTATASEGLRKAIGCAVEGDGARVGRMHTAQHLHHRALAGAVLAQEGMNLARLASKIGAMQGDDAAEMLVDAGGGEKGLA